MQTVNLTQHEREEFKRFAASIESVRPARARLLLWLAGSLYPVELKIFDKCKAMYRAWLVFGEV
jgi:hypothetical protein